MVERIIFSLLCLLPASPLMAQKSVEALTSVRIGTGTVLASGSLMDNATLSGATIDIFNNLPAADMLG